MTLTVSYEALKHALELLEEKARTDGAAGQDARELKLAIETGYDAFDLASDCTVCAVEAAVFCEACANEKAEEDDGE